MWCGCHFARSRTRRCGEGLETAAFHSDANLGSRERGSRAQPSWLFATRDRKDTLAAHLRNSTTTPATASSAPSMARTVSFSPWNLAAMSMAKIG